MAAEPQPTAQPSSWREDKAVIEASAGGPTEPNTAALTYERREGGSLKALQVTAEPKRLQARLQAGELTLEQALARDEEVARGMRDATPFLRAIPGAGDGTERRLMRDWHRSRPPGRGAHREPERPPAGRRGGRGRGAGRPCDRHHDFGH
jgi:hypothetical protein